MSYYVKRTAAARQSWTGPIRSEKQADREATAWREAGWVAEVVPSSAAVRAEVRSWEKANVRCR